MLKKFFMSMCVAVLFAACGQPVVDKNTEAAEAESFGEAITAEGAVSLAEMIAQMGGMDSLAIKVKGTVDAVCQTKGCWMSIKDDQAGEMFVQFEDYGFFVPKDIAGRQVIMEGYAYLDVTSVEDLRHFAEDEGLSQEEIDAITEPEEELKFMATGVLLLPASQGNSGSGEG